MRDRLPAQADGHGAPGQQVGRIHQFDGNILPGQDEGDFRAAGDQDFGPARDLATGTSIGAGQRPKVGPRSTLVLYRGRRAAD